MLAVLLIDACIHFTASINFDACIRVPAIYNSIKLLESALRERSDYCFAPVDKSCAATWARACVIIDSLSLR